MNSLDQSVLIQRARAFDHLFDALVVTDLQGVIIDWNKGSENLYGYTRQEAIGQPVSILHVTDDESHVTDAVLTSVQQTGKWSGEVQMLHKDGHIGWVESIVVPLLDDEQQVIGALGINRDISERVKKEEHLDHQAHYDMLTKLPNRYLLLDRLSHLIKRSLRNKCQFAVLYIDLDNFKTINDNEGHLEGDHVLVEAARRLRKTIRESDTVARIGGDEFIVLVEDISDPNSVERLISVLKKELDKPHQINEKSYFVSGSIGAAVYPEDGTDADTLLLHADKAMYAMKKRTKTSANKGK